MKKAILCVDDEKTILDTLTHQLRELFGEQYAYEKAESGDEALEILEELNEDGTSAVLVISDWLMPGMKGDEFLIKVKHDFDFMGVKKILLTGHAPKDAVERAYTDAGLDHYIQKPWKKEDLKKKLNYLNKA